MTTTSVAAARRAFERAQRALDEAEQRVAQFGAEPPVGSVLRFTKQFGPRAHWSLQEDRRYDYAALRTPAGWYLTGREIGSKTWDELCAFIGDASFQLATEWTVRTEAAPLLPRAWVEAARVSVASDQAYWDRVGHRSGCPKWGDDQDIDRCTCGPASTAAFTVHLAWSLTANGHNRTVGGSVYEVRGPGGAVVAKFPSTPEGQRRAQQSARDRSRRPAPVAFDPNVEPPLHARVRSLRDPKRWARREANGWTIWRGYTITIVCTTWSRVRKVLGDLEPDRRGEH